MDARTADSLKNHCEEWLIKCIICHCCGKLPQSLWKCGCDHLFCDACKSIKKCDVCALPFARRSKRNKGPVREHIYDKLIESAHELVTLLNINVASLVHSVKDLSEPVPVSDSKPLRSRKESVSPQKRLKLERNKPSPPQKESNVSVKVAVEEENVGEKRMEKELRNGSENKTIKTDEEDDEEDEKPEGRFGRRKYVRKKSAVEPPRTPRSKCEDLFEKIVASESNKGKHKRNETGTKSATIVDIANSNDDSITEEPVKEVPKLRPRMRFKSQKITKPLSAKAKASDAPPVKGRRTKRGAVVDATVETRKSSRLSTPSPKKRKINASNETSGTSGMDVTVFDFESDEKEEKKVKRATKKKEKGDTCDSSNHDNKDRVESLRQEPSRLRARSTSTIKSESIKSRNSSPKNSIVLLATSLSKDQMSELYKFRKKFRCTVKEAYDNDVTHVICRAVEDNYTSRTIKYLHGLVGNKWLLNYDWITDSIREGEILDEERYEVSGTCKDKEASKGAPKKSRTTQKKLFKDYVAYFEGKFVPQNIPPKDDLIKLFKSAGGVVIDTTKKLNANIKKKQKLFVIREDNQEASAATESLIAINVAEFLSMITEFDVNDDFVNFA